MNKDIRKTKKPFIGRQHELETLKKIGSANEAGLVIVYGRRRVGKTELIEHAYRKRNLLKLEGVEGHDQAHQRAIVMQQLATHVGEPLLRDARIENWIDVFRHIHRYAQKGKWTIYFEEVQWLASYETDFVSELKYAWDNFFRRNPQLVLVLCGSATSFMINQVVHSKALYNRSQHEIHLREFSLHDAKKFFGKASAKEVMDGYLCVGGIPEYLNRLKGHSSILLSLCDQSFKANSFFSNEYERIFISNFATNKNYKKIIDFLSRRKFATRDEILSHLKISTGGRVTELLDDLVLCGFIESYAPYHLSGDGKLIRYCIRDNYLQFFYKFIHPQADDIQTGVFNKNPKEALSHTSLQKWLGFAFERFCRRNHHSIAQILGFSGVRYRSGAFFSRSTISTDPGYQLDLVFDRDDNVVTLCEIKYLAEKVPAKVMREFEQKLELYPITEQKTIQKVLISTFGPEKSILDRGYFDFTISLQDFLR